MFVDAKLVSAEELHQMLEVWGTDRNTPGHVEHVERDRFMCHDGERWIGADNTTGDFWVEEFDSMNACIAWLKGEEDAV